MRRHIAALVIISTLALPACAFAAPTQSELVPLYTQLIEALREELTALQNPTQAWLSIMPVYGQVPLVVMFTLHNPSGTGAIDYGDGHSSGSNGCVKNSLGYCDLSQPVYHSYQLPGTYKVTLYDHQGTTAFVLSTAMITVVAPQ